VIERGMGKESCYISFVVTVRNDDYGHRFLFRVQNFLDNLTYLCEKHKLKSEIIFVEWNPPNEKNKIWMDLKIKKNMKYLKLRFIEVPNKKHRQLEKSDKFPLFEFIGKNVGIRRANGEFIITTNPDLIFNEELIEFLSRKKLDSSCFYRIARHNVNLDLPENISPKKVIGFCEKNWKTVFGVYFKGSNLKNLTPRDLSKAGKDVFTNIFRTVLMIFGRNHKYLWYHGGAPGDFILMSKKSWIEINGFPQMPVPSCGVDGYGVIMAAALGLKMKRIKSPARIYHQFHERPFSGKIDFDYNKYKSDALFMLKNNKIMDLNKNNWGLKDNKLQEKVF
jgi:hypothetical protein